MGPERGWVAPAVLFRYPKGRPRHQSARSYISRTFLNSATKGKEETRPCFSGCGECRELQRTSAERASAPAEIS